MISNDVPIPKFCPIPIQAKLPILIRYRVLVDSLTFCHAPVLLLLVLRKADKCHEIPSRGKCQ